MPQTGKKSLADKRKFIKLVQDREASISIGASTARGMGKGTVKAARDFLRKLNLSSFVTKSEKDFRRRLDASTNALRERLPRKSWGAARKFLNIFLRGAFYNRFLCEHYGLQVLEEFLEVPLDKSVAEGLRREQSGGTSLPRWKTIIRLRQDRSDKYQECARQVSLGEKLARVHLDLLYWRDESAG